MKKIIMTIVLITIMIIAFGCSKTFAADEKLTLESVNVSAPEAGIYGEGQEITIKFTFNKSIKGTMPRYTISFGKTKDNKIELETEEITVATKEVLYKYTIKSGDNGELKPGSFTNTTESSIEDESGNKYYLTSPFQLEFETKILADTTISWTDFTNAKIKTVPPESSANHQNFYIKFEDVTLNQKNMYYARLSHQKDENIQLKDQDDVFNNAHEKGNKTWTEVLDSRTSTINGGLRSGSIYNEVGDLYLTICEIDDNTNVPKIVLKSQKIERLKSLPLTQRISVHFFEDRTSAYCWEPRGEHDRIINYKIGQVTDINILKALKNNDSKAFEDLLKYAKEATSITTGTLNFGDNPTVTKNLNLENRGYYFVYFEMDTENGKYIEIEDVNLYQAYVKETGNWLANMASKDFKWNLNEQETTTDESVKKEDSTIADFKELPNTGITITIVVLIAIISITSIVYFKKYKLYKGIK